MSKILLLEDDPLLSATLLDLLRAEGFEVVHAIDGEEALEISYAQKFDLYLLDINVPLLNGIDFLKLLRDSGDLTPAFFISALRDIKTISQAFDTACDDYIKKPFDFDELLVRIKAHIVKKIPKLCMELCDMIYSLNAFLWMRKKLIWVLWIKRFLIFWYEIWGKLLKKHCFLM